MDLRKLAARDGKPHGFSPGRQEERIEGNLFSASKEQLPPRRIDRGDAGVKAKIYALVFVKIGRPEGDPISGRRTGKKPLRKVWTVIGNGIIRAKERDRTRKAFLAQRLGGRIAGGTTADDGNPARQAGFGQFR